MFDKVEVGLIGCGLMGSQHARHLVEIEGANLRALADVNLDAARRLKQEAGGKYCTPNPQDLFNDEKIEIRTFFAPNHTYDENTFTALKESGINGVIDGYGLMPYTYKDIKFIPQLFYKILLLPFGIQSSQIHINYWNEKDYINFEKFIEKNHNKIISYDDVLKKISDEKIYKNLNKLTEKILKSKRFFLN